MASIKKSRSQAKRITKQPKAKKTSSGRPSAVKNMKRVRKSNLTLVSTQVTRIFDNELGVFSGFDPANDYLPPTAASSITWTIRLGDQAGNPASGVMVNASRQAETLRGAEWRTVNGLVSRWPAASAQKLRERIQSGLVRLEATFEKSSVSTNAAGDASFVVKAWHVCGNENLCGSDRIALSWNGGSTEIVLRCGVPNLGAIPSEQHNGFIATGGGYFVQSPIVNALRAVGVAWRDTAGKPVGMPNYFAVTDGSIRWGGLSPPHMTHRFGGAIDGRPISTDGQPTRVGASNYSREGTRILLNYFHQTGASEIRFADTLPDVTVPDASHNDHFHVSWLTNPLEPWFIPMPSELLLTNQTFD